MRIFEEQQRFNQWYLYVILGITFLGYLLVIDNNLQKSEDLTEMTVFIFFGVLLLLVTIGIFSLRLETRIDASGITARFAPFNFLTRHYQWKEIKEVYVRKYSPLTEYGGWGVRGLGSAKAYNVSGNNGIQIVTIENQRFLIGTKNRIWQVKLSAITGIKNKI